MKKPQDQTLEEWWANYDGKPVNSSSLHEPVKASQSDAASDSLVMRCIDARKGYIRGKTPIFILELEADDGQTAIKFLGCNLTKQGNFSVDRNSDFAKLYRLSLGTSPNDRFTRADQLLGHFVGLNFGVTITPAVSKNAGHYLKVTYIKPQQAYYQDAWSRTGVWLKSSGVAKKLAI